MTKRIIYYGDFTLKHYTERYIAHAFRELGYEVLCLQEDKITINNIDSLVKEIQDYEPELVLFSKGSPKGDMKGVIEALKEKNITTVCWLFDLYFGLPFGDRAEKLKNKVAPYISEYLITTDGGHKEDFKELGYNTYCVRQGIHEPEAILYDREKVHEVIFVGADHFRNRAWLFEGLKDKYAGKFEKLGFPKEIRGLELNELYASTKVVVGDSQPSPNYWSNRIYETLGRGGFLIHPDVQGLEKEFTNGVHLVTYKRGDMHQLCKLIDYYLLHDEEREKIRRAGFEHVKNNFTYKNRVKELLNICKKEQQ